MDFLVHNVIEMVTVQNFALKLVTSETLLILVAIKNFETLLLLKKIKWKFKKFVMISKNKTVFVHQLNLKKCKKGIKKN